MNVIVQDIIVNYRREQYVRLVFFSLSEILNKIHRLLEKKTPRPGDIINNALKYYDFKIVSQLIHMFNGYIHLVYFPK